MACRQTDGRGTLGGTERSELTDEQSAERAPHLPPQKPRTGQPAKDHRLVLEGILWVLRTGAPWRDLPERYGPWRTVSSRFRRWQQTGVRDRVLAVLQRHADADGRLDRTLHVVDSTVVRAHQHAAGARGGTRSARRSVEAGAASRPSSTCGANAAASRWSWRRPVASGTSSRCCPHA